MIVPAAGPKLFAGLRISLSPALILMVYSELLPGASNGLGHLLNTLLLLTERRALAWNRST